MNKAKVSFEKICFVFFLVAGAILNFSQMSNLKGQDVEKKGASIAVEGMKVNGPFSYENLSLYFFYGPNRLKGKEILTLDEALKQKKIIVYETDNVGQLMVENISQAEDVFIQSGDVVKGGKQDRVLQSDLILPKMSGKVPIKSFCVEKGRWRKRGTENVQHFSSSPSMANTKSLRLAVRKSKSQSEVWKAVDSTQKKLSHNLKSSVKDQNSPTSYQLSMENKKLNEETSAYLKALELQGLKPNIIGFAYAINGKLSGIELYPNRKLFTKLWPKLIRSIVAEAFSEDNSSRAIQAPKIEQVKETLLKAKKGNLSYEKINEKISLNIHENENFLLFETVDTTNQQWLRRSYLVK